MQRHCLLAVLAIAAIAAIAAAVAFAQESSPPATAPAAAAKPDDPAVVRISGEISCKLLTRSSHLHGPHLLGKRLYAQ